MRVSFSKRSRPTCSWWSPTESCFRRGCWSYHDTAPSICTGLFFHVIGAPLRSNGRWLMEKPETGVCTMRLDEGLDTGPVYACEKTAIDPEESVQQLSERLAVLGSDLVKRTIRRNRRGNSSSHTAGSRASDAGADPEKGRRKYRLETSRSHDPQSYSRLSSLAGLKNGVSGGRLQDSQIAGQGKSRGRNRGAGNAGCRHGHREISRASCGDGVSAGASGSSTPQPQTPNRRGLCERISGCDR